ncbi:MAG: hypothetical protein OXE95_10475 [Chloroflexi bacterium]|nr:hypothetical protein [Chloroflexota bacterium]MCY4247984.1 hypothetical protein [Chloroflexota bacterium]
MPQVEVMLDVPLPIEQGLATGQLERVGGVVREAGSKRVVGWLREGGQVAGNVDLASGALKNLLNASAGDGASGTAGLVDAASNFLMTQQMQSLTSLLQFNTGLGMMNLTVTTISLVYLRRRMAEIEDKIDGLYDEFEHDREANLQAGLESAEDAATAGVAGDKANQREYARQAVDRFREARKPMRDKLDELLWRGSIDTLVAQIVRAIEIDAVMVRCYLDNADIANAKRHLADALAKYRHTIRELIQRHLHEQRSLYFHKSVSKEDFLRYIAVRKWLADYDKSLGQLLLEAIFTDRENFWDPERIESIDPASSATNFLSRLTSRDDENAAGEPRHLWALEQFDLLIENFNQLRGIDLELKAIERLGISTDAWRAMQEDALEKAEINLAEHDDYVFMSYSQ